VVPAFRVAAVQRQLEPLPQFSLIQEPGAQPQAHAGLWPRGGRYFPEPLKVTLLQRLVAFLPGHPVIRRQLLSLLIPGGQQAV
jgi:hypothetical protein